MDLKNKHEIGPSSKILDSFQAEYFFYIHGIDGVFRSISKSVSTILGYEVDEFLTHYSSNLTDNPNNIKVREHSEQSILGIQQPPFEVEVFHKNGEARLLEVYETPIKDSQDNVIEVFGIARDITIERERIQEIRKLSVVTEQSPSGVLMTDRSGRIVFVNQKITDMSGYTLNELKGNTPRIFKSGAQSLDIYKGLWAKIIDGGTWRGELLNCSKEGKLYWVSATISPVFDENLQIINFVSLQEDITIRKSVEKQLEDINYNLGKSQKLENLGLMTSGVIHDLNNMNAVIAGYSELLLMDSSPDTIKKCATKIRDASRNMLQMTRNVLSFYKDQPANLLRVSLNELIEDMNHMMPYLVGKRIKVKTELAKELKLIHVDPSKIQQVLVNLLVNARDACSHGGDILIRTYHAQDATGLFLGGQDSFVVLEVQDTGQGMDFETKEKVFKPFYTTKPEGKGTGLGLSTARDIISEYKGIIEVDSTLGVGTTFKIYLPSSQDQRVQENLVLGEEHQNSRKRVLVADDEVGIVEVVRMYLELAGFEVLACSSGEDAVQKVEALKDDLDLAILDIRMHGLSGYETATRLRVIKGDIPVIFMSGYFDELPDSKDPNNLHYSLRKPFNRHGVLDIVKKALG